MIRERWEGILAMAISFDRIGRAVQMRIRGAEDLALLRHLDEAHWVATSAPVNAFHLDTGFLAEMDPTGNGRITSDEVMAASDWLLATLADHTGIDRGADSLRLEQVVAEGDGLAIRAAMTKMLRQCEAERLTLGEVRRIRGEQESAAVSEAGVVLPGVACSAAAGELLTTIVACCDGVPHPSGGKGVDGGLLDGFVAEATAYLAWCAEGRGEASASSDIMPFGERTAQLYDEVAALQAKLDQFFALCRARSFSAEADAAPFDGLLATGSVDMLDPVAVDAQLGKAPLAAVRPDGRLSAAEGINPLYADSVAALFEGAVAAVLGSGTQELTAAAWQRVRDRFGAYADWQSRRTGARVEGLGEAPLQALLAEGTIAELHTVIATSREAALVLGHIRLTEKLLLLQANLLALANNFVSFPHLYAARQRALFEIGSVVMDGRRLNFALRVVNRAEHAALAKMSDIFVLYLSVMPPAGDGYEIAVPVTAGGRGNLCVGKRGILRHIDGQELDVRVVQIIENPISIIEAIVSPLQRLAKLVSGRIEKMTTKAEKQLDASATASMDQVATREEAAAPASGGMLAGGALMGGGVALAAISSAVAYISSLVNSVGIFHIVGGLLVALVAVIAPASVLALVRLRNRDLSAILEGAGWAINARMRLTLAQGRMFTQQPLYPIGALGVEKERSRVPFLLIVVGVALWGVVALVRGCTGRELPVEPPPAAEAASIIVTNAIDELVVEGE